MENSCSSHPTENFGTQMKDISVCEKVTVLVLICSSAFCHARLNSSNYLNGSRFEDDLKESGQLKSWKSR